MLHRNPLRRLVNPPPHYCSGLSDSRHPTNPSFPVHVSEYLSPRQCSRIQTPRVAAAEGSQASKKTILVAG